MISKLIREKDSEFIVHSLEIHYLFREFTIKDTIAIPKSVKKSPGFTKLRSQNPEIRFSVVHDVI